MILNLLLAWQIQLNLFYAKAYTYQLMCRLVDSPEQSEALRIFLGDVCLYIASVFRVYSCICTESSRLYTCSIYI